MKERVKKQDPNVLFPMRGKPIASGRISPELAKVFKNIQDLHEHFQLPLIGKDAVTVILDEYSNEEKEKPQ